MSVDNGTSRESEDTGLASQGREHVPAHEVSVTGENVSEATMTQADVKAAFLADLQAVLDKWGAELEAKDHYQGYPECGEDVRMTVTIAAVHRDHETVREWTEIDLGSWMKGVAK